MVHDLRFLFRVLFRRGALDEDVEEELHSHLEQASQAYVASGLPVDEARRRARADFGSVPQIMEQCRDVRSIRWVRDLRRDVGFALRGFRRNPTFTLVSVLMLTLGIGANVTVFSVMRGVLWRPLPYPNADRLVALDADAHGLTGVGLAPAEIADVIERSVFFDEVAALSPVDASLTVDGEMERVAAVSATDNFLPALGVAPRLGRTLSVGLDVGTYWVRGIVISHDLWRRRFSAEEAAVGRHITVNNLDVEIVGVLPEAFRLYLPAGAGATERVDVWFPTGLEPDRRARGRISIGSLKSGATLADAQRELDALTEALATEHPDAYEKGSLRFHAEWLQNAVASDARPALVALAVAVAFVLLMACANVASLMLARAKAREHELALRRALGAGRARLTRQLLTEALLLATLGGVAGLVFARWGINVLEWMRPTHLPRQGDIAVDASVTLYALLMAGLSGLLFGVVPALRAVTATAGEALKAGGVGSAALSSRRTQRGLVVAQIALAIVPLVAAGLMLRTFVNLTRVPLGFDASDVLTAKIALNLRTFADVDQRWRLHQQAIERVRHLPGVEAVSAVNPLPLDALQITRHFWRDGEVAVQLPATMQTVMPGYLRLMGISVRAGREFSDDDINRRGRVVVVEDRLARQLWPGMDPVGQRLWVDIGRSREALALEVIGVTNDVRVTSVREAGVPHLFLPYHLFASELSLVVKTSVPAETLGPAIKKEIEALGTERPVHGIRPMTDYVDASIDSSRFTMLVLLAFAGAVLLLAAVGVYGTLTYLAAQRRYEFGLRLALGARPGDVIKAVLSDGMKMAAIGTALGLATAAGVVQVIRTLLYGVTPLDWMTLTAVSVVIVVVSLVAASCPALLAGRVDPCTTLRGE